MNLKKLSKNLRTRNSGGKKRKVAVFDIDGTIFRSSLLIELVEALIAKKVFPKSARHIYESAYRAWLDRKGPYSAYIESVIRTFERHIVGVREKDFAPVVRQVVSFHKDRVYRFTRDLVFELKKKHYFLLAISHSPRYVVGEFAKRLGFDKIYGRFLETDNRGRFTGGVANSELILDKKKVLLRALERNNLTLEGSVGVGDTDSDIGFLKLVRRPICFNPNSELCRVARRRGWEIVVERKDVIYTI